MLVVGADHVLSEDAKRLKAIEIKIPKVKGATGAHQAPRHKVERADQERKRCRIGRTDQGARARTAEGDGSRRRAVTQAQEVRKQQKISNAWLHAFAGSPRGVHGVLGVRADTQT